MLRRLVILGTLLSVLWTPSIPGQTSDRGNRPSHSPKNTTDASKSPAESVSSITVIRKNCDSEAFKNDSDCKVAEHKPSPVEIGELPTANVTIQRNAERDIFDWIAYAGELLLVVVGMGTLIAVWVQATRMMEHADELHSLAGSAAKNAEAALAAAQAAQTSADAAKSQITMVKDKERARISVSVSDDEFEVSPAYSFDAIIIKIANDGTSSAFSVKAKGEIFGQPSDQVPYMGNFIPLKVPNVIRANNDPLQAEIILVQDLDLSGVEESPVPYFFHIGGVVEYEDVFGESHKTTFRYRLQVNGVRQVPDSKSVKIRSIGGWKRCGSPEENRAT